MTTRTPDLFICNRLGLVHAGWRSTCTAVQDAPKRKQVTPLQVLVYALPPCDKCFYGISFYRTIHGGAK